MRLLPRVLTACLAALVVGSSLADTFPSRAIKLVVPFPPGQSSDTLSRLVGEQMAARLGQPVVIDNRPGAGGVIGTQYVATQPADGYTLVAGGSGPMTVSPTLQPGVARYDAVRSFSPVAGVARIAQVIVVSSDSPIRDLQALVGSARRKAGVVTYGSSGNGTTQHLFMEMLNAAADIRMTHVPYKGSAPALNDLIGGQIDLMSDTITAMTPLIRAGKVRPIAVTSARRWPTLPEVPTVAEQGYPGYAAEGWVAFLAPAGTPPAVVGQLEGSVRAALADPPTRARIAELGFLPMDLDQDQLRDFLQSETRKFKQVIETAHIKVE
jgi:tripartite-type tricarboxylate transporter receptor subunit TctC